MSYKLEKLEIPVKQALAHELIEMWEDIFGESFSFMQAILEGCEVNTNHNYLYIFRKDTEIVASCRLTISVDNPRLGCIGEVATRPEHRGNKLASILCAKAAKDFDYFQGQGLFLATENLLAAKVYAEQGWRFLAGTNIMLRTNRGLPEEFMLNLFQTGRNLPVKICKGDTRFRVSIIPLIIHPHGWMVLDSNLPLFSTRFCRQTSCEGLYKRYDSLGDQGEWFVAVRDDAVAVGAASAKWTDDNYWCVEAFAYSSYERMCLENLYRHACEWAQEKKQGKIITTCPTLDPVKIKAINGFSTKLDAMSKKLTIGQRDLDMMMFELL